MIFYFSGTGNTKWAAQMISEALNERLLFIPEESKGDFHYVLKEGERIGFFFPTHGWQPPRIVREFISQLKIEQSQKHYCYALTTCGDSIGQTMEILNKDLRKAGLPIAQSVYSIIMPESYVCLPFMYTDTEEKEKEKIDNAKLQLTGIIDDIRDRKVGIVQTTKGVMPWIMSHVIGCFFNNKMVTDKKFTVDKNLCIHCGLCQKVCPTNNISFEGHCPTWMHDGKCTSCLSCYHHCPRHAINYGIITRRRGQYFFGHKKNS